MCHFLSWIEYKNEILFITKKEMETTKGKKLRKHLGSQFENDIKGHGAIRYYYNLKENQGTNKECVDFSSPKNFPTPVVKAIKAGAFNGIAIDNVLLTKPAWAEYEKVRQPASAEYEKVRQTAWAEYEKVRQTAWAEYEKVRQPAWAEYEKVEQPAWAEYEKVRQPASAEYEKVRQTASAEYEKVRQTAWAEYEKVRQTAFWRIFKLKKNRRKEWR